MQAVPRHGPAPRGHIAPPRVDELRASRMRQLPAHLKPALCESEGSIVPRVPKSLVSYRRPKATPAKPTAWIAVAGCPRQSPQASLAPGLAPGLAAGITLAPHFLYTTGPRCAAPAAGLGPLHNSWAAAGRGGAGRGRAGQDQSGSGPRILQPESAASAPPRPAAQREPTRPSRTKSPAHGPTGLMRKNEPAWSGVPGSARPPALLARKAGHEAAVP